MVTLSRKSVLFLCSTIIVTSSIISGMMAWNSLFSETRAYDELEDRGAQLGILLPEDRKCRVGFPDNISCREMRITPELISLMLRLHSIQCIQLRDCQVDRGALKEINNSCPLLLLRFIGNCFTDDVSETLPPISSLRHLDCVLCPITNRGVRHLCRSFPNLVVLGIHGTACTSEAADSISCLKNLKTLSIVNTGWDGESILRIIKCLSVENLEIPQSIATDNFISELQKVDRVKSVTCKNPAMKYHADHQNPTHQTVSVIFRIEYSLQ